MSLASREAFSIDVFVSHIFYNEAPRSRSLTPRPIMAKRSITFVLLSTSILNLLPHHVSGFSVIQDLHSHLPILQNAIDHASSMVVAATADANNPLQLAATTYRHALKEDPLQTKICTGIFLAVVGDGLAQAREPQEYNVPRAASFAAFDGCYRAVQQFTYPPMIQLCKGKFLHGILATLGVASSTNLPILAAIEQTLVSQLVIIPTVYYPVFYAVTGAVQGLTLDQTIQRAKDTFVPLMKRNLLFWIPIQFFCFAFVEENLQIPILTVCGLVWTIILSVIAGSVKVQPVVISAPTTTAPTTTMSEEELILQDDPAYCVTGMEDNCLIDPDDMFHAPAGLEPLKTEMRDVTAERNFSVTKESSSSSVDDETVTAADKEREPIQK
jgi:protein Mpv17